MFRKKFLKLYRIYFKEFSMLYNFGWFLVLEVSKKEKNKEN